MRRHKNTGPEGQDDLFAWAAQNRPAAEVIEIVAPIAPAGEVIFARHLFQERTNKFILLFVSGWRPNFNAEIINLDERRSAWPGAAARAAGPLRAPREAVGS